MLRKMPFMLMICCLSLQGTMKLISPAFSHNEAIPTQYTCDGANISPALAWSDAPEETQSFALIVDDPDVSAIASAKEDAPAKVWVHWILFNIPSTVEHILENQGAVGEEVAFLQGATDFNSTPYFAPSFAKSFGGHGKATKGLRRWGGPCPPSGTHHYHFTLYALDTLLDLPAGATKEQILQAMHGHILEQTTLIGTYQRTK